MVLTKKKLWLITALYLVICAGANFLGTRIPANTMSFGFTPEQLNLWMDFNTKGSPFLKTVIFYMAFVIPCGITIIRVALAKNLKKFFINIPLTYSLTGILGWIWAFLAETYFSLLFQASSNISVQLYLLKSFTMIFFEALTTFILSYLILEILNRKVFLPRFFPAGHLVQLNTKKNKSKLRLIFIIFYIAVCFYPVIYLMFAHIPIFVANNIEINKPTFVMAIIFVIFGLILTFLFQYIITKPVKLLIKGAENIKNGDYNQKIDFVSNDDFGMLTDSFNDMTKSLKEKEFMRDTFGKVVDPYVRDYLLKGNVALGGETINISVMFCDIRSFTAMSENMEPAQVVSLLNEYFTSLGQCISKNHGVINKYIGDAIMAIFGAPVHSENHALDAYNAAQDMRAALIELNKNFASRNMPQIRFGIGIHSGPVLAGNIGASNRMEYTVIGDTVNTASRIESLCKEYKTDLLLTESTASQLGSIKETLNFVANADIRGKEEKVKLFN